MMTLNLFTRCAITVAILCLKTALADETSKAEKNLPERQPAAEENEHAKGPANRLAKESSPYLLLHAHNPVDWFPWGPEAFEKARTENKPIFLSVGYSSCYWCHVMERQVFSNPRIAAFMNEHFVNIKVDREERPDVDDIYMTSLIVYQQAAGIGGGGGWPLSLFLTPDGNPIAGATYLPPEDTPDGRTGFMTAAERIRDLWKSSNKRLRDSADVIAAEVRRLSRPSPIQEDVKLDQSLVDGTVAAIREIYDSVHGGVDFHAERPNAPRFPNVPRLMLLLESHATKPQPDLLAIVEHSLRAMAEGGIRDHLGGGFHRYSTDRRWHVPHFEKMLYDQAQLLLVYSKAATATGRPLYHEVAAEIAGFVHRELTLPDGGFCSALDAETNAIEGEYYVWSAEQIPSTLGDSADFFMTVYGMKQPNPFEHGFVLHLPASLEKIAGEQNLTREQLDAKLRPLRATLLEVRAKRPRPLLDDKVLTEWNGLMIEALAASGQLPGRERDLIAAAKAADFLLKNLRAEKGGLSRTWRNGKASYSAYLDDYAAFVAGLLELHTATNEARWLNAANELTREQIQRFYDAGQKTFFYTSHDHEKLIARTSSAYDSTFPSGNSVTARNLLRLAEFREAGQLPALPNSTSHDREIAESIFQRFGSTMQNTPAACAGLAMALNQRLNEPRRPGVNVQPASEAKPVTEAKPAGEFKPDVRPEENNANSCVPSPSFRGDGGRRPDEGLAARPEPQQNASSLNGKRNKVGATRLIAALTFAIGLNELQAAITSGIAEVQSTAVQGSVDQKDSTKNDAQTESQSVFRPVLSEPGLQESGAKEGAAKSKKADRKVKVKIYPYFNKLERGGKCPVAIELSIDDKWHINANPANPTEQIPTELKITSRQKVRMTRVKYPDHKLLTIAGFDEPCHVYGGKVIIYAQLEVDAAETAENAELEIRVRYQACNDVTCMPPDEIVMSGKLPLASAGDAIEKTFQDKFPKPKPETAPPVSAGQNGKP